MAISDTALVTRAARVLLEAQPSEGTIEAFADRITNGEISKAEAINIIYQSGGRVTGQADELARMFFILFGRAPDYATFTQGMAMLEDGYSMVEVAEVGLSLGLGRLSDAMRLSNEAFVDNLVSYMFTAPSSVSWLAGLKTNVKAALNAGTMTRAQLLEVAVNYDGTTLIYHQHVAPSLIYLIAAGREATAQELSLARGISPLPLARDVLTDNIENPFSNRAYLEINDDTLTTAGILAGDLVINLASRRITLDGSTSTKVIYSSDAGESESIVSLARASIADVQTVDMRGLGSGLDSVTFTGNDEDTLFYGALTENTATGGAGNDTLVGNTDVDSLSGGGGDDVLTGDDGTDTLTAGAGDDLLDGGAGADTLVAGAGEDRLIGGTEADTFKFAVASTYRTNPNTTLTIIDDFGNGADKVDFSTLFGKTTSATVSAIIGNADRNSSAADAEESYVDLESLERNGVVLVYNNGTWLDEVATDNDDLSGRTRNDIYNLFNTFVDSSTAITLTTVPTLPSNYVVITYDPINDADVWLISNLTNITTVELSEIQLIGHINGYADVDLWTSLISSGSILG